MLVDWHCGMLGRSLDQERFLCLKTHIWRSSVSAYWTRTLTYSGRHLKTSGTALAGLCHDFANMMTSSLMFITPWMSQMCSLMVFWNISPNWYQNSIWCTVSGLLNVVMYLLSGARDDWWYPERRSSFKNTVAALRVHVHQVIDCLHHHPCWRALWLYSRRQPELLSQLLDQGRDPWDQCYQQCGSSLC